MFAEGYDIVTPGSSLLCLVNRNTMARKRHMISLHTNKQTNKQTCTVGQETRTQTSVSCDDRELTDVTVAIPNEGYRSYKNVKNASDCRNLSPDTEAKFNVVGCYIPSIPAPPAP
jgi:hypothetical protein